MSSDFENRGTQMLIPGSATRSAAAYLFEQFESGRWRASFGARYDYRSLSTDGNAGIGVPAQRRVFPALTGSMGVLYRVTPSAAIVANLSRGFRAPAAPDLFANGFHEGTRAFERGNPELDVETSLNSELGMRVDREDLSAEVTGFVNDVSDYIYLRPFGTGLRAYDSLQVVQGDARLAGVEARAQYRASALVTLHVSGDYVHGQNRTAGVPLTFIPPLRVVYGIRMHPGGGAARGQRYLSLGGETNRRQSRLDPGDVGPPGYTLVSLGAGWSRVMARRSFTADASVRNLFDTDYRSFMSRYKEYASGPGRSIAVKVGTAF